MWEFVVYYALILLSNFPFFCMFQCKNKQIYVPSNDQTESFNGFGPLDDESKYGISSM